MSDLPKSKHAHLTTKSVQTEGTTPPNVREGEKWVRVIASAPVVDRDNELIDTATIRIPIRPKGWKYAKDLLPTDQPDLSVLTDHKMESGVEKQVGSVRSMFINADGELETVVGLTSLQRGQEVHTLAKEDHFGNNISMTFDYYNAFIGEDGRIYDSEAVELSFVFKGANQDARVLAVSKRVKGDEMADAKTLEEKKLRLKALQDEIDAEEAQVKPEPAAEPTPEEKPEPQPEAEEPTPAEKPEEPAPEAPEQEETPAPEAEPEVQPPQPSKTIKQEKQTMSKDIAIKQVKDVPEVTPEVVTKEPQLSKEEFAAKQFVAWVTRDSKTLTELNQKAIDSHKDLHAKAIMSAGVTADGGAIVPNAQLLTDIYTTLGNYSTVSNDLRVITLSEGDSLDVATLVTDVIMSEVTAEGGDKGVTKPDLGDTNVALREFAGIAVLTKKLVRQAAVNIYDILRESFARAIANERATMALTDANSGIAHKAGRVVVTTAAGETTVDKVTVKEVKSLPYKLPVAAVQGAKYYISRELLEVLDGAEDGQGRPLNFVKLNGDGLSGTFSNGFPFAVEEILGKSGQPHAVFGNMGRYGILLRQGTVENETFDTGMVVDGATTHNLLQQNKLAQRVAFYENVGYPLPGAFAVLELATA